MVEMEVEEAAVVGTERGEDEAPEREEVKENVVPDQPSAAPEPEQEEGKEKVASDQPAAVAASLAVEQDVTVAPKKAAPPPPVHIPVDSPTQTALEAVALKLSTGDTLPAPLDQRSSSMALLASTLASLPEGIEAVPLPDAIVPDDAAADAEDGENDDIPREKPFEQALQELRASLQCERHEAESFLADFYFANNREGDLRTDADRPTPVLISIDLAEFILTAVFDTDEPFFRRCFVRVLQALDAASTARRVLPGTISIHAYARFLYTLENGSWVDQALMTFRLFDWDGDGLVSKSDVFRLLVACVSNREIEGILKPLDDAFLIDSTATFRRFMRLAEKHPVLISSIRAMLGLESRRAKAIPLHDFASVDLNSERADIALDELDCFDTPPTPSSDSPMVEPSDDAVAPSAALVAQIGSIGSLGMLPWVGSGGGGSGSDGGSDGGGGGGGGSAEARARQPLQRQEAAEKQDRHYRRRGSIVVITGGARGPAAVDQVVEVVRSFRYDEHSTADFGNVSLQNIDEYDPASLYRRACVIADQRHRGVGLVVGTHLVTKREAVVAVRFHRAVFRDETEASVWWVRHRSSFPKQTWAPALRRRDDEEA